MTSTRRLLEVAARIPQPFTLEDLGVEAWRQFPDVFGLRGYPYPDHNRVCSKCTGREG